MDVLKDNGKKLKIFVLIKLRGIDAVNENLPLRWFKKAAKKFNQRCFAGAV